MGTGLLANAGRGPGEQTTSSCFKEVLYANYGRFGANCLARSAVRAIKVDYCTFSRVQPASILLNRDMCTHKATLHHVSLRITEIPLHTRHVIEPIPGPNCIP